MTPQEQSLLNNVLTEVRTMTRELRLRDDMASLLRQISRGVSRLEERAKVWALRLEHLEARMKALERPKGNRP